ncbi:hypothetical protein VTK26DRAFT_8213 [Humicola hyalothermophila]
MKKQVATPNPKPLARELLIASLAVQRAALATKKVLATIKASQPPPSSNPSSTAPTSGYLPPPGGPSRTNPSATSPSVGAKGARTGTVTGTVTATKPPGAPPQPPRDIYHAKSDDSPVTVADYAAQALLVAAIRANFPDDRIVAEEDASELRKKPALAARVCELVRSTRLEDEESERLLRGRAGDANMTVEEVIRLVDAGAGAGGAQGGRYWTMDPVDGTSAFMRGEQYAISLALLDGEGKELIGVLGCPNLKSPPAGSAQGPVRVEERNVDTKGMGLMLAAVRGQGAKVRPMGRGKLLEAWRINRRDLGNEQIDLRNLHFVDSCKSPATLADKVKQLATVTGARYPGTDLYSSHMRYAAMALGSREFVQVRVPNTPEAKWSIWDHAGSQLIYTESGAGKVTDLRGNPIDFTTGRRLTRSWGLITADESIHRTIVDLVADMQRRPQ